MDTEQRLVALAFEPIDGGLHATVPGKRTIAPPGWYMLFVEDDAGIPSVARWVHVS
jgi:hypothetical protein